MTDTNETEKYHLYYNEIPEEVLNHVKTAIKSGLFKKNEKTIVERMAILSELNEKLSRYYEIPQCQLQLAEGFLGSGTYVIEEKIILVNKPSLVTYLHEFKHHLNISKQLEDTEESCKGFSHSVFFLATPKLFKDAVDRGLLIFQQSM